MTHFKRKRVGRSGKLRVNRTRYKQKGGVLPFIPFHLTALPAIEKAAAIGAASSAAMYRTGGDTWRKAPKKRWMDKFTNWKKKPKYKRYG